MKDEVVVKIEAIWEKSSLPTIGRKSMETKLKNVLEKYAVMKARRTRPDKLQFENLFDVSASKCNHVEIVVKYGKVYCKYAHAKAKFLLEVRRIHEHRE